MRQWCGMVEGGPRISANDLGYCCCELTPMPALFETGCLPIRCQFPVDWLVSSKMLASGEVKEQSLTIRMGFANFDDYWKSFQGGQGPVGKISPILLPT